MARKIPDYVGEHFEKYPLDNCVTPRPLLVCRDGMAYSVQASKYHYCAPRDSVGPWSMVEVWSKHEHSGRWVTRDPEGWVPVEKINRRIHRHGGAI